MPRAGRSRARRPAPSPSVGRLVAEDRGQGLPGGRSRERPLARQHLVEDGAEGEEVAARVGGLAADLLRGDVACRAHDDARLGGCRRRGCRRHGRCLRRTSVTRASPKSRILTRPSEVRKTFSGFRSRWTIPAACAAARPSAIAAPMSTRLALGQPLVGQALTQRLARQELGHGVRGAVDLAKVEERKNIGVRQRRDGAGLALEPRDRVGRFREALGKDLDRDFAAQTRVARAIDLSHAACAERRHDRVRTEPGIGSQPHRTSGDCSSVRPAGSRHPGAHENVQIWQISGFISCFRACFYQN